MIRQWYNQNTGELQSIPPWYPMKIINYKLQQQYFEQGWLEVDQNFIPPTEELTEESIEKLQIKE